MILKKLINKTRMSPTGNLYYVIGEIAYVIAI
jgi:hypothetical protein